MRPLLWIALSLGILVIYAAPMRAASSTLESEDELQLGPIETSSSSLPSRGYQSRSCGFDLNDNGNIGEPADCNVCDASLVGGKIVANTLDPDGDGVKEDLIYVDCDGGLDNKFCGLPGAVPCLTIEHAFQNRSDGPEDGAEDIVCFTGTCSPNDYYLPATFHGLPNYWTKPKSGSETRDWQFPGDPAMLVGWDTDNDQSYPPYDPDDVSVMNGDGLSRALVLNGPGVTSYFEIAHFSVRAYGAHHHEVEAGAFIKMFNSTRESSHGIIHDLSLTGINKGAGSHSGVITFPWFSSGNSSYIAVSNIKSKDEGGYTFRGSGGMSSSSTGGPWRFQNLTITAHGCEKEVCGNLAGKIGWKFWGWIEGVEILDSIVDGNEENWSVDKVLGVSTGANTADWDIVNNEFLDLGFGVFASGLIPDNYYDEKRYSDDIVISRNLFLNTLRDRNGSILINGSGGNQQAVRNVWVLNNIFSSSLTPTNHIYIRQGNTDGPNVTNIRVFNNTMFGESDKAIQVLDPGTAYRFEELHLRNNIVAGLKSGGYNLKLDYPLGLLDSDYNAFDPTGGLSIDGDDYTLLADWRTATGGDMNSRACLPTLKSPPFDLHLDVADLCARNKGGFVSTSVTTADFELESRPYGVRWDIGADEWHADIFAGSFETGSLWEWTNMEP